VEYSRARFFGIVVGEGNNNKQRPKKASFPRGAATLAIDPQIPRGLLQ
jgi:hypothetical protein